MVSKMVTDRQKSAEELKVWIDTHGPEVAGGVKREVGAKADPTPLMAQMAAQVTEVEAKLVAADDAHTFEASDDAQPRARRDQAVERVTAKVQELRDLVSKSLGAEALPVLGLQDPPPRDPVALEQVANQVVSLTQAKGFKAPSRRGVKIDLEYFVGELDGLRPELSQALKDVKREEGELQKTQFAKDAAMDAFDTVFVSVATVLRGLAGLGGLKELAEKLPVLIRTVSPAAKSASQASGVSRRQELASR